MAERDDHAEILRIRERLHKLEGGQAVTVQVVQRNDRRLDALEPRVTALEQADKIEQAVAVVKSQLRGELFSTWQKIGAGFVGIVAVADFVRGLVAR